LLGVGFSCVSVKSRSWTIPLTTDPLHRCSAIFPNARKQVSFCFLRDSSSAQHQGGYAHPNVVTSIVTAIGGRRDLKTPSGEKWRGRFRSRLVRDGCPGRGTWALKGRGGGGVTGGGGSCRRRGRVLPVKHGPPSASASALLYRHHSSGVSKCGKSVAEERTVIAKNV
jgi:hypothetical protein